MTTEGFVSFERHGALALKLMRMLAIYKSEQQLLHFDAYSGQILN